MMPSKPRSYRTSLVWSRSLSSFPPSHLAPCFVGEIRSELRRIVESDEASMLEWTSRGTLAGGGQVAYDGVSDIEHPGGAITRFQAHFDPRVLGRAIERAA
jgi:hypothetical protein